MIIYVNGCSHTEGHCVGFDSPNNWPIILADVFFENDYFLKNGIDETVSNKKNFLINEALSGGSNQRIEYTTIQTISTLLERKLKVDYALIQLTSVSRRMHILPDGDIRHVNPYDFYDMGLRYEPHGSILTLHHILNLQNFFKLNNIKYLFIPYFDNINYEKPEQNLIDFKKFTTNFFKGYIKNFKKNKFVCDNQGHPNKTGNQIIYEDVIKSLEREYDMNIKEIDKSNFINFSDEEKINKNNLSNFIDKTKIF